MCLSVHLRLHNRLNGDPTNYQRKPRADHGDAKTKAHLLKGTATLLLNLMVFEALLQIHDL